MYVCILCGWLNEEDILYFEINRNWVTRVYHSGGNLNPLLTILILKTIMFGLNDSESVTARQASLPANDIPCPRQPTNESPGQFEILRRL